MPNTTQYSSRRNILQQLCSCRVKLYAHQKKTRDPCKRKRQVFVYNPEEEIWHEPYMQTLRREFSDESVLCDSKIELPWRDIALPVTGVRIRPDVTAAADREADEAEAKPVETEKRDSAGIMMLPWKDLLITETLQSALDDPEACDSSVEIPWGDLALERSMVIRAPKEDETCVPDDIEIPWDDILVPRNIVIQKKRKHPSSGQPPRTRPGVTCATCGANPCCAKARAGTSTWIATCM